MIYRHRRLKPVLKWWVIFCFIVFATGYAQLTMNLFSTLNNADVTKLSFVVIGIFYSYMIALGVKLSKYCNNVNNQLCTESLARTQKHGWFLSDIFMALGFLGTLVGFIYMLDLTGLSNSNAAQATLITLTTGMKTALYTTVMALIGSIVIKCTLYILANDVDKIEEEKICVTIRKS